MTVSCLLSPFHQNLLSLKVVQCSVDNIIYNLVFRKNGRFEEKNCPVGRRTETGEV
jgi:hypothetical protein